MVLSILNTYCTRLCDYRLDDGAESRHICVFRSAVRARCWERKQWKEYYSRMTMYQGVRLLCLIFILNGVFLANAEKWEECRGSGDGEERSDKIPKDLQQLIGTLVMVLGVLLIIGAAGVWLRLKLSERLPVRWTSSRQGFAVESSASSSSHPTLSRCGKVSCAKG